MKVAIFAGGFGTRLSEETSVMPKPMVSVAGRPILWHIMKIYEKFGLTEFVVLGGYKVEVIANYFLNYATLNSDFTVDLASGEVIWKRTRAEPWRVTVLNTGEDTMTGGRLKRAAEVLGRERFCLTYGDGVSDVNIADLIAFHEASGKWATMTTVRPAGRFGVVGLSDSGEEVVAFREKDSRDGGMINGGFFVCEPQVLDLVDGDTTVWEQEPLQRLVEKGQLGSYRHFGFWHAMDTLADKRSLETAWAKGAPWMIGAK